MNTVRTVCFLIAAFASYFALLYRLCQAHRSWRDTAYRGLVITLLLQCVTFTMGALAQQGDTFLGVGNLAILLMHLSAVTFCVSAQIILQRWASGQASAARKVRGWLLAGGALDVLLVVLFLVGDGPDKPADAFNTGSDHPLILTYLLVFIVSQAVPVVTIFLQCGPYARMTDKPWLRRALRLLSAGAVVLFLYCLTRTANILSAVIGAEPSDGQLAAASVFSAVGIAMVSVSMTISSWGPSLSKLGAWARNYRSYRALYPLWRDLYESSPDIVLEPSAASAVSDLRYRLHRRVVEIRDGWRELRPYIDSASASDGSSYGSSDGSAPAPAGEEDRQACAEAAQIRQALRAKRAGARPGAGRAAGAFEHRDAENFDAEVHWLVQVSLAYRKLDGTRQADRGAEPELALVADVADVADGADGAVGVPDGGADARRDGAPQAGSGSGAPR
ncbi:MAB_1171c family putative transporter [Streptomyces boncukensis]|uniref:MAB_1171c family putative transporter n=1 Tax=Streptomyces boncukensis TaxID=2711219 RepID=UPI0030B9F4EF